MIIVIITKMFSNVRNLVNDFNKKDNSQGIDLNLEPVPPKVIKEYKGNQYQLDAWLNQLQYNEYVKNNAKNKKVVKNKRDAIQFETAESCYDAVVQASIKKKWARLDTYTKKNRVDEYLNRMVENNNIDEANKLELKQRLNKMIDDKSLKPKDIVYDDEVGIIKDITAIKL
jgi:hypothetical protein